MDPFKDEVIRAPYRHDPVPYVQRIRMLWQKVRDDIPGRCPEPPGKPADAEAYLRQVDEIYITDAYHSLSIEGYQVNADLIERVRRGGWNPEADKSDLDLENGLAARA